MAYYLSKRNREIILNLIEKIKDAKTDTEIQSSNPRELASIFRSAAATLEFGWLRDKYSLRLREQSILFKLRSPDIIGTIKINKPEIEANSKVKNDFFSIVQNLVMNKPDTVTYINELEESDYIKLHNYCSKNNYLITKENNNITFTKIIGIEENA